MLNTHCNAPINYCCARGLDPDAVYKEEKSDKTYYGRDLMNGGIPLTMAFGEYNSYMWHFSAV